MTSKILSDIHESVKSLHEAGVVDAKTMRSFDELCIDSPPRLTKTAIKKIRIREKMSQPIFAKALNVSPSAVKKWELGEKQPSGAALRLLSVVEKHGVDGIL